MIQIQSSLENMEGEYSIIQQKLSQHEFTLGGNWDYDHGSFDRYLDEAHKVWLRIPFQVTRGSIDDEMKETDARIKMGTPYVLKHLYNEGLDGDAIMRTYGAMLNQFQEPTDKDADVEPHWVNKAEQWLREVEQALT